tara:strand:+ start:258 stop:473 length:216 start_codon:yes stop_codon:yes gene_type:complete
MILKVFGFLDLDGRLCDALIVLIESLVERIVQVSDPHGSATMFPGSLMHQQGAEAVWSFTVSRITGYATGF